MARCLPHFGQGSSSGTSGFDSIFPSAPTVIRRVVLHSGYAEQARKGPNRPRLRTMSLPHLGQLSLGISAAAGEPPFSDSPFSTPPSPAISFVFLHSR